MNYRDTILAIGEGIAQRDALRRELAEAQAQVAEERAFFEDEQRQLHDAQARIEKLEKIVEYIRTMSMLPSGSRTQAEQRMIELVAALDKPAGEAGHDARTS